MPGHVFIVRGDLRRHACDAWLIPTSGRARPGSEWFLPGYDGPRQGEPFAHGGPRVQPLIDQAPGRPRPWLGRIGSRDRDVSWYADGAAEFLDTAATAIAAAGESPLFGRARPLLALPVVGTGQGGAAEMAGEVVQELLPRLRTFAGRSFGGREFDIALVCLDSATHAAAQAERVRRGDWPTDLTDGLKAEADRLASHALRGELALFLGAGVSTAAAHLLVGERFDPLLTEGERLLRDALARFAADVTGPDAAAVRRTVAWPQVERLLRGLGFEPPPLG